MIRFHATLGFARVGRPSMPRALSPSPSTLPCLPASVASLPVLRSALSCLSSAMPDYALPCHLSLDPPYPCAPQPGWESPPAAEGGGGPVFNGWRMGSAYPCPCPCRGPRDAAQARSVPCNPSWRVARTQRDEWPDAHQGTHTWTHSHTRRDMFTPCRPLVAPSSCVARAGCACRAATGTGTDAACFCRARKP